MTRHSRCVGKIICIILTYHGRHEVVLLIIEGRMRGFLLDVDHLHISIGYEGHTARARREERFDLALQLFMHKLYVPHTNARVYQNNPGRHVHRQNNTSEHSIMINIGHSDWHFHHQLYIPHDGMIPERGISLSHTCQAGKDSTHRGAKGPAQLTRITVCTSCSNSCHPRQACQDTASTHTFQAPQDRPLHSSTLSLAADVVDIVANV